MKAIIYRDGNIVEVSVPGSNYTVPYTVNDDGNVAGTSETGLFIWRGSSGIEDMGSFGGVAAFPVDMNNHGDVLVNVLYREPYLEYRQYAYGGTETLVYRDGEELWLPRTQYGIASGAAINDAGSVAGLFGVIPAHEEHAFVWDAKNGLRDLGIAGESSAAADINDHGVVVGKFGPNYEDPSSRVGEAND